MKKFFLIFSVIQLTCIFSMPVLYADTLENILTQTHSIEDVENWVTGHLQYRNIKGWDPAPDVQEVIDHGYGDCKMLAGVVAELLSDVKVKNWIVTIQRGKMLHMFNVYVADDRKYRVVDNAKWLPQEFDTWKAIVRHFGVPKMLSKHASYSQFQSWFNKTIYPQWTAPCQLEGLLFRLSC